MMYDDERNVICGTIVTSFRESWPAPQKRVRHIGRIQMPLASALFQEWSLDAGGAWGYKFNYKANESSSINSNNAPDSSDSDGSSSRPAPATDVRTGPPCKGMQDETDSVLSAAFLNTVRAVVSKLLLYVLDRYRKEICNGCQINHPSQCQHECLEEMLDYFYEVHHSQLMERLWTGRFIPTIQRALNACPLCVSEYRVRGACDFLLHDFKTMRCQDLQHDDRRGRAKD
ncbi:hypothetical protein ABVT39_020289 [Epinephelus coioides]